MKDEVKDEQTSQKSNCAHSFPKSGTASDPLASFCDSRCTAATESKYERWAGTEEEGAARRKAMMTETTNGVRKPEVEFFWSQPLTSYYNGRLNSSVGGTCRRALNQLNMFPATLKQGNRFFLKQCNRCSYTLHIHTICQAVIWAILQNMHLSFILLLFS